MPRLPSYDHLELLSSQWLFFQANTMLLGEREHVLKTKRTINAAICLCVLTVHEERT
jgi:hypothetical protein